MKNTLIHVKCKTINQCKELARFLNDSTKYGSFKGYEFLITTDSIDMIPQTEQNNFRCISGVDVQRCYNDIINPPKEYNILIECPSFLEDPLLWLSFKIFERKFK